MVTAKSERTKGKDHDRKGKEEKESNKKEICTPFLQTLGNVG
jgi:hypothetical protein